MVGYDISHVFPSCREEKKRKKECKRKLDAKSLKHTQ